MLIWVFSSSSSLDLLFIMLYMYHDWKRFFVPHIWILMCTTLQSVTSSLLICSIFASPISLCLLPTCWFMRWHCINSPSHCDNEFTMSSSSLGNNCCCLDCFIWGLLGIFSPVVIYLGDCFHGVAGSLLSFSFPGGGKKCSALFSHIVQTECRMQ